MLKVKQFNIIKQPGLFVVSFILSIILIGCAAKANYQQVMPDQKPLPLLQFQKTPCYGPCPAYQADIMEDGGVTFISWGNINQVAENDTLQLRLSKEELLQLKKDIKALNYTSLQDAYLSEWTDRPTSYLTFYQNGKSVKRIKYQEGGPVALVAFQEQLHQSIISLVKKASNKTPD